MPRYMKNRTGVVFFLDEKLLGTPSLDFSVCTETGENFSVASSDPAPAELAESAESTSQPSKKSSKKGE